MATHIPPPPAPALSSSRAVLWTQQFRVPDTLTHLTHILQRGKRKRKRNTSSGKRGIIQRDGPWNYPTEQQKLFTIPKVWRKKKRKNSFTSSVINKFTRKSRKHFLRWGKPGEFCHGAAAAARAVKIQETDLKSKRSTRNVLSVRTRTLNRFNNWKGWKHFSFFFLFAYFDYISECRMRQNKR